MAELVLTILFAFAAVFVFMALVIGACEVAVRLFWSGDE